MKYGVLEIIGAAWLAFVKGSTVIKFQSAEAAQSQSYTIPTAYPTGTQALVSDSSGVMSWQSFGIGTVTSIALSAPSIFTVSGSPITGSGTLGFTLASQSGGSFLAAPSGANGTPTFRAIQWGDVSAFGGVSGSSFALGNDGRLHSPNTDLGTNQTSFQINTGAAGVRLKDASGALRLRNAADNADADLICASLFVTGTTTTINSETITLDDNLLVLNNNYTGSTPTENGGLEVERGTLTNASFIWDETNDLWRFGLAGSELPGVRVVRSAFTNASLTGGVLTINHALGQQFVEVMIYNNLNRMILPDEITCSSTSACAIDLTSYGTLTGNWNAVVMG